MSNVLIQANDTVLIISEDGKRFYVQIKPGHLYHTHQGIIEHNDLIGVPLGSTVVTSSGKNHIVLEPSLSELMKGIKRKTQIIYPKEAGRIIFKMNIYPGRRVIEAGSGSGALTLALARFVAPTGRVYSYEAREEALRNARANLEKAGVADFAELKHRNISAGFDETNVDALFLDMKEPWRFLDQAKAALKPSGFFGAILPTTNQVTELLIALKVHNFGGIEVEENFLRNYKPIPGRLRPHDMMVGHTGYLIFARNLLINTQPSSRQRKINWRTGQATSTETED